MRLLQVTVASLKCTLIAVSDALSSGTAEDGARISFATPELLWQVLTARRWEILKAMAGREAMSIRAAARLVGRDVKAVHADVHALLDARLIDWTADRRIVFPYDAIHVDFMLKAA